MEKNKIAKSRNSPIIGDNGFNAKGEELSEKMRKLKVIYDMPKINLDSDEEVEQRINEYFEYCIEAQLRPTVEGLGLAIGVNRSTLYNWEVKKTRAGLNDFRYNIIKKAKDYIAFLMSDLVMENKINPVTCIFYAKNYFQICDRQVVVLTPNNPLGENANQDEIQQRLLEATANNDYSDEQ